VVSHPPFGRAKHKKRLKKVMDIMTEKKENSLDRYLIVISTT